MSTSSLRSFEYLESIPGTVFMKLYRQPSTALAIFRRMLTLLAKNLVMAMLYTTRPLPVSDLELWIRPDSRRERDLATSSLERFHMLSTHIGKGKKRAYALTEPFATSLRQALTGSGNHHSFGVPYKGTGHGATSVAELDEYARQQWEGLLGYMVGSTSIGLMTTNVQLSEGVKKLLEAGGLVETRGRHVEITEKGFAFVLLEVNTQVWTVLILYLDHAEEVRNLSH